MAQFLYIVSYKTKNMGKYPTYRLNQSMEEQGIRWMPVAPWHLDNNRANYDYANETEKAYQKALKDQNETIKWAEETYGLDDWGEDDFYTWLIKPVEEKLKAPDADFSYDGRHKALMPALAIAGSHESKKRHFQRTHKGNWYWKIRVPSIKRGKSEWVKFYNEFPDIAADVRLGNRRFVNGAKLKYIW